MFTSVFWKWNGENLTADFLKKIQTIPIDLSYIFDYTISTRACQEKPCAVAQKVPFRGKTSAEYLPFVYKNGGTFLNAARQKNIGLQERKPRCGMDIG